MKALEDLIGELSKRAGIRGREFERICHWFLNNAPEYRSQLNTIKKATEG